MTRYFDLDGIELTKTNAADLGSDSTIVQIHKKANSAITLEIGCYVFGPDLTILKLTPKLFAALASVNRELEAATSRA